MCEASATPTGFADIEALRLTDPGMVAFPHAAVVAPAVVVFGVFLLDRETVFVASLSPRIWAHTPGPKPHHLLLFLLRVQHAGQLPRLARLFPEAHNPTESVEAQAGIDALAAFPACVHHRPCNLK